MRQRAAAANKTSNDDRLVFAVAYASLLGFAFVFQSLPPVLRLIMTDLQLDHTQAGLLMGFFAVPGIILTVPGGWLADRYGSRVVGIAAAALMVFGTLAVANAGGFVWLAIGRLISGAGAMILIVVAAGLVSNTFKGPRLGTAMGIYNTGMPLGTIISFNLLGAAGLVWGWRIAVAASTLAGLLALALLIYRQEDRSRREAVGLADALRSTGGSIWLAGLAWLWFNAAAIAFLTFSPDYFTGLGYRAPVGAFLASFIMWGALIVSPAIGPFMGDARRKQALIIAGSLISGAVYAALPSFTDWQFPLVVTLGLAAALVPAPLFALPAELVDQKFQATAFGIFSTCLNIGILLGPFVVGGLRDQTGAYGPGFLAMCVFSLLAALSVAPMFWLRARPD